MPNKNTFSIKPIKDLIERYLNGKWIDPFANDSIFKNQLIYDSHFKSFYLILSVLLTLSFYLLLSFFIKAFNYKDLQLKY